MFREEKNQVKRLIGTIINLTFFRLGFLPAVAGYPGVLPWDRLPAIYDRLQTGCYRTHIEFSKNIAAA